MNLATRISSGDYEDYVLKENEHTILKLRYKSKSNTARIETEIDQRIFIIEDEGLLKTRLVFKNEYGVSMGRLFFDGWSENHGVVETIDTRFRFVIRSGPAAGIMLYRNSRRNLVYSCNLSFEPLEHSTTTGTQNINLIKNRIAPFIISLSWYMSRHMIVEQGHEFNQF
jgi:hypothetical protein